MARAPTRGISVISVAYHDDLKEVQASPALGALLDAPAAAAPFDRLAWWQGLEADCGLTPMLAVASDEQGSAVLPLQRTPAGLTALANWYSFRVRPVVSPGADARALLTRLARDLGRHDSQVTLSPVPDEGGEAHLLADAFRAGGWFVDVTACDTNHVLDVGGRGFAEYLAGRPGQLRTTLKRKAKKVTVALHTAFDDAAWDDYEAIYAQSWKPEEGSPAFLRRFAEAEGAAGRLRMAVARAEIDGVMQPVAAQFWTVEGGTAFIHKLAHIEAAKPLSPGTTLSAALFEQVIDRDHVAFVDFGTGDDGYKRDWMEYQRPRYRLSMLRWTKPSHWPQIARFLLRRLAGARAHG
ncbi:MAG: GNAT family N-acetyltransferase [Sphingomonadales bacterium]|nr:GNAT family N-acetyltransferase [Sphingomonadales bacterium]